MGGNLVTRSSNTSSVRLRCKYGFSWPCLLFLLSSRRCSQLVGGLCREMPSREMAKESHSWSVDGFFNFILFL
ncbi:hypothetical protein K1719_034966 [Acacia pycnantha]|nr:hypothetical protein K1719_034966 [Acacia pycnantha]